MDKIAEILGSNIRRLRKERIGTQEQLAEVCGFDVKSINRWENGKRWPELEALRKIAKALEVPVESLFADPNLVPLPTPKIALKVLSDLIDSLSEQETPNYLTPFMREVISAFASIPDQEQRISYLMMVKGGAEVARAEKAKSKNSTKPAKKA